MSIVLDQAEVMVCSGIRGDISRGIKHEKGEVWLLQVE